MPNRALPPTLAGRPSEVVQMAWRRILEDAGDELPDYRKRAQTDAIGQSQVKPETRDRNGN